MNRTARRHTSSAFPFIPRSLSIDLFLRSMLAHILGDIHRAEGGRT